MRLHKLVVTQSGALIVLNNTDYFQMPGFLSTHKSYSSHNLKFANLTYVRKRRTLCYFFKDCIRYMYSLGYHVLCYIIDNINLDNSLQVLMSSVIRLLFIELYLYGY